MTTEPSDLAAYKPSCECVMRGMTGGKAHPLCPVHGHLHDAPERFGIPVDPEADERLRADLAAITEAERRALRGAVALVPAARGMTVSGLIDLLAQMPPDAEVVVNASDGDIEVFALVKAAEYEPTCADVSVCRLYADQEDDDAC